MSRVRRHLAQLGLTVGVFLAISVSSPAQEDPAAKKPDDSGQGTVKAPSPAPNDQEGQVNPGDKPTPGYPINAEIHPAGKAGLWAGTSSPLRWGPFAIGEFTYEFVHDEFRPKAALPISIVDLNILRTSLILDKRFGKQRLLLQYEPQLAILNGKLSGNGGFDNSLALGSTFQITPRLSLLVTDGFAQVRSRTLFPPNYLAVDEQAGNLLQNTFLTIGGNYLSNELTGVVNYQLHPRDLLAISSTYRYTHNFNDNDPTFVNYKATGNTVAVAAAYTHGLTPRQNLGLQFSLEMLQATNVVNVPPGFNTFFEDAGVFYAYQLARTWWFRGNFGAQYADYRGFAPNYLTLGGGGALLKSFTHAIFALEYSRGRTATNFITPRIGDRADFSFTLTPVKRLVWNNGIGYYKETGADPKTKGAYGASTLELEILRGVYMFGNYTYADQSSNTPQLLSGIRKTVYCGIRWEPYGLPKH
jgi:hypothetical protein